MDIQQPSVAGTLESSDIQVSIYPNPGRGIEIRLQSIVKAQYGDSILETAGQVLRSFDITDAVVELTDKGALDWVIRARIQAACCRATGRRFDWKGEDD